MLSKLCSSARVDRDVNVVELVYQYHNHCKIFLWKIFKLVIRINDQILADLLHGRLLLDEN